MLQRLVASRVLRLINLAVVLNFGLSPAYADAARVSVATTGIPAPGLSAAAEVNTLAVRLTTNQPSASFGGINVRLAKNRFALNRADEVSALLRCNATADAQQGGEVLNLTDGCGSLSVYTTGPIMIEVPYRKDGIQDDIEESAIKVFRTNNTSASLDAIQPLESFVDLLNKRTVATLREQSGHYIAGILKSIERPDRAPLALDSQAMARSLQANPLTGVPIVAKPQPNSTGDAKLAYPLEFPGARSDFRPSVSISYASKSGYGPLGEGWHLNVPEIAIETRWGVPIYDPDYETETYLFGGEQLVPESGESFVGDPADELHLLPMPHRTTYLRPRKKGEARFVLRRDDGLWRFIRHGDRPTDYWWEAWQEKPGSGAPRISYFGNAPGRVPAAIEGATSPRESAFVQPIGPITANPNPNSISKWLLAREVDAHRNAIDYDWQLDCRTPVSPEEGLCGPASAEQVESRGPMLRRVLYTSNLATEETVLRCREKLTSPSPGCQTEWALYEALLNWLPVDSQYRRSDARSGGLSVHSRLLDRVDFRTRQVQNAELGEQPLKWNCSDPFVRYSFAYRGEFGAVDQVPGDVSERGTGRAFLKSVTKRVSAQTSLFRPKKELLSASCSQPPSGNDWAEASYTTRFEYDIAGSGQWRADSPTKIDFERRPLFGLVDQVRNTLFGNDGAKGPVASSMLGTTATTDASVSFFAGLNFFNPGKTNSFGVKAHGTKRTGYRESTLLLDADGDGITDLVVRQDEGSYNVHRGVLDAHGRLSFAAAASIALPGGFPAFNREPFQSSTGFAFESHLFGTFFGSMSSSTSATQDAFVTDVNGDGKPDVISNGAVYFNTSEAGRASFDTAPHGGFIDPRVSAGVPITSMPRLLADVRSSVPPTMDSADAPRVDPVRAWRAPFSGDVIVHGKISYAPGQLPSDYDEQVREPDTLLRQIRLSDHREGLHFTIELNRRPAFDGKGQVRRCFGEQFRKEDGAKTIDLTTPTAAATTPVPIVSCFDPVRSGWPALPPLPAELGTDKGLLVSVETGDVLYVRAHSIDNAQDDVIQFDPQIDYIRLSEDSLGAGGVPVQRDVIYGAGAPVTSPGIGAVIASFAAASSACSTLDAIDQTGLPAPVDESASGLCDPWGRSIVRYRATEEKDPFLNASGLMIAPYTGSAYFSGTLTKPRTLLAGDVAIRVLPAPPVPDSNGNVSTPDPGCAPDRGHIDGTEFRSLVRFDQQAGDYRIDPKDSRVFLNRGQRVCVFIRFFSLDTNAPNAIWPQDMSGFKWADGLSALFDRKLLVVQLDKPGRDPDDFLTDTEKSALIANLDQCPAHSPANIHVNVPNPGEESKKPTEWTGTRELPVHLRCIILMPEDRHWVTPRSAGAVTNYLYPQGTGTPLAHRFSRRLKAIKLPSSALVCPANNALKEYRFRLDTGTIEQPSPIPMDVDNRRPHANDPNVDALASKPFATKQLQISVVENGQRRPVTTRAFTIRQLLTGSDAELIADDHLALDIAGPLQKVDDLEPARLLSVQVARNLPRQALQDPFDRRNAFYVEFRVGQPVDQEDDGVRVLPVDRVGYSFCAPNEAEIEVVTIVDNGNASDNRDDLLLAGGACSPNQCPISSASVRFASRAALVTQGQSSDLPIFVLGRLPLDPESYRGWSLIGITSEFIENLPTDDGTVDDPTTLSNSSAEIADTLEKLPTVRDYNRLRLRFGRMKDLVGGPTEAGQALHSDTVTGGPCGAMPARECIRDKFSSQVRVHPMTGSYRARTAQRPNDWTYCTDNPRSRAKFPNEDQAEPGSANLSFQLRSRIGLDLKPPHYCSIGPDVGLWVSKDYMSASRLGVKDRVDPVAESLAARQEAITNESAESGLVRFLPRVSNTKNSGFAASAWVGISQTSTTSTSEADVADMNGDGFPDQIVKDQVYLTDPSGRLRCLSESVWAGRFPCANSGQSVGFGTAFSRDSKGDTSSLSIAFSSPKTFAMGAANATARIGAVLSGSAPTQAQASRDPALSPLSIGAEFTKGTSLRESEIVDMNGDGLPDLVRGSNVNLNFGHAFLGKASWPDGLMKEENVAIGLSAGLGYGNDNHEFGGGISASSSRSRQKRILADLNGDGLVDVVWMDGGELWTRLNTGFGFGPEQSVGSFGRPFDALGQGETDALGANAYFTFSIPIPLPFYIFYIILNPGASLGAALNRQVIAFRDVDADGLSDLFVGGGLSVAGDINMMFDNRSATAYKNPFGTHGLLTHIYLATNPESVRPKANANTANYQLGYSRSSASENDPQSRYVLSEVIARDGVPVDDAYDIHDRRTCHSYESGFFDRFERRFLGFSKVVSVEGCVNSLDSRPKVQLDLVAQSSIAAGGDNDNARDSANLNGIRRIERTYANRSLYESGILLAETTIDLSLPAIVAGASAPVRSIENSYVLLDVARSSQARRECFALGVLTAPTAGDARPLMRNMLTPEEGGLLRFPTITRNGESTAACPPVPSFNRESLRLTPILVQSVQTSSEGGSAKLTTATQFEIDHRARITRACDLGQLNSSRQDDVCSELKYDEHIQLSFIHAATGGGVLAFDRRDRVRNVEIRTGQDSLNGGRSATRRRTAAYDSNTGDLVALCQFEDPTQSQNPCESVQHIPRTMDEMLRTNRQRVAVRHYRYDVFGNVDRYVSPVSGNGYYLSRHFNFDTFQHLVELKEASDYCKTRSGAAPSQLCIADSASELGTFISQSGDVDWRHAVATTQIDINRNALRTILDGAGRPIEVIAAWAGKRAPQPTCGTACTTLPPSEFKADLRWGQMVAYEYRVTAGALAISTPAARVRRFADASLYKKTGSDEQGSGEFVSDYHFDQLGRKVRSITPADVCIPGTETPDGAACEAATRATHVATGIVTTDAADRAVDGYLPVSVTSLPPQLRNAIVAPLPRDDANGPRTRILSDGFDRPLHVRLADGNSYAFRYLLTKSEGSPTRHRTISRDSRCVPTAIERDERGLIRGVHEFANAGTGNDFDAHAYGSSFDAAKTPEIIGAGWIRGIDVPVASQQVAACVKGDVTAAPTTAAPGGRIESPVDDPFLDTNPRRRRTSTLYDYDALSQLVGVHLPNAVAVLPIAPVSTSDKVTRVSYDALGRQLAVDDPDRGFEYLSYDLGSNVVCQRSGPRAGGDAATFATRQSTFRNERLRSANDSTRPSGEDHCLEPEAAVQAHVRRVMSRDYLYDRPSRISFRSPAPIEGERKTVTMEYGRADDVAENRAGKQVKLADVTGTTTTAAYHALGMPARVQRSMTGLRRNPALPVPATIGTVLTEESYDAWGVLSSSVVTGGFLGVKSDGSSDTAKAIHISEAMRYRYSSGGQVNEVRVGPPCRVAPNIDEDCRDAAPATRVIQDAAFDERGNNLRLAFGHGVVTRNAFDLKSNRLLSSSSRLGVPCVEYGPGDDCSTSAPPILFQNLSYAYDPAGLLTAYDNAPRYADLCAQLPAGQSCPAITKEHAGIQGLLVTSSTNRFSYDERARLRNVQKLLAAFGRDNLYWALDDIEFARSKRAELKIGEDFAFTDSHLLSGIRRSVDRRFVGQEFDGAERTTILHTYGPDHPTAPRRVTVNKPGPRDETQRFNVDLFGRVDTVNCSGCLERKAYSEDNEIDVRKYGWDPDDTLAVVRRRIEPTENQNSETNRRSKYYAEVNQTYDHAGNRAIKRLTSVIDRPTGGDERKLLRETVYADERLTVMREPGARPEALLHVFAGQVRLASKRVGNSGIFTYHSQLATRTISDVVYSRGDDPTTSRIHQQIEYAAFGELLLGRERTIAPEVRDSSGMERLARPLYRFNAKELDEETQLTHFGARHYDQRFGLWLSPDPVLADYLAGARNSGIFAPKNLASYGFGWGNPLKYVDIQGKDVNARQTGSLDEIVSEIDRLSVRRADGSMIQNVGTLSGKQAHEALMLMGDFQLSLQKKAPFIRAEPLNAVLSSNQKRYINTKEGPMDMRHFLTNAGRGSRARMNALDAIGQIFVTKAEGFLFEELQSLSKGQQKSAFSPEDIPSNERGQDFGSNDFDPRSEETLSNQIRSYFEKNLTPPEPKSPE